MMSNAKTCSQEEDQYESPVEIAQLQPGSLATLGGVYGWSVAFTGRTAVVGSPKGRGVFVIDGGWSTTDILNPSYPEQGSSSDESFGYSVAVGKSSDEREIVVAVGAPEFDSNDNTGMSGAVYIFTRSKIHATANSGTWVLLQRLDVTDIQFPVCGQFGTSVSLDGDRLLVGASGSNVNTTATDCSNSGLGHAFIFERTAKTNDFDNSNRSSPFVFVQELIRETKKTMPYIGDGFGERTSLHGSVAVVGVERADVFGDDEDDGNKNLLRRAGAAHLFESKANKWIHESELVNINPATGDLFGSSVCVRSNYMIIGAPGESGARFDAINGETIMLDRAGAAHMYIKEFRKTDGEEMKGWNHHQRLTDDNPEAYSQFGAALSLSVNGRTALISSPAKKKKGNGTGAVYAFSSTNEAKLKFRGELVASDGEAGDTFGFDVALDKFSNRATGIVGASGKWEQRGTAYMIGVPVGAYSMNRRSTSGHSTAPDEVALVFVMILLCLLSSAVLVYCAYQWRAIMIASKNFFCGGNHNTETPTHRHRRGRRGSASDYESEDGMPSNRRRKNDTHLEATALKDNYSKVGDHEDAVMHEDGFPDIDGLLKDHRNALSETTSSFEPNFDP